MKGTNIVIGIIILLVLIGGGWYLYSSTATGPKDIVTGNYEPIVNQPHVTFPAGAELLAQGHTYTITWTTPSIPSATSTQVFLIDASLESQGASVSTVDRLFGVEDNGSYSYTIPKTLPSGMYRIEVGTLMSQPFQISSTSPQAGTSTPANAPAPTVTSTTSTSSRAR